jgi:hypothetical protein
MTTQNARQRRTISSKDRFWPVIDCWNGSGAAMIGVVSQSGGWWRRLAHAVLQAAEAGEFAGREDF